MGHTHSHMPLYGMISALQKASYLIVQFRTDIRVVVYKNTYGMWMMSCT